MNIPSTTEGQNFMGSGGVGHCGVSDSSGCGGPGNGGCGDGKPTIKGGESLDEFLRGLIAMIDNPQLQQLLSNGIAK